MSNSPASATSFAPFSNLAEFKTFSNSAVDEGFSHVPVVKEILADLDTPVSTYLKLADQGFTYLFESVQGGDEWGRYSIIGLPCSTVYRFFGNQLEVLQDGESISTTTVADPLSEVRKLQRSVRVASYQGLPEMIGGLVGYFAYETIASIEPRLAEKAKLDPIGTPDILLMSSENVLVFDNLLGRIFMVTLTELSKNEEAQTAAYHSAEKRLEDNIASLSSTVLAHRSRSTQVSADAELDDYHSHFKQRDFEAAVDQCKDYIRDGDIMQVVLSQRLSTKYSGRSIDIYRALRTINPSPYMYFLNLGDFDIVGSSPEILVRLQDDTVTVRPIAGTRKRGATIEQDMALEQELLRDEKELAEHLMLIDLGRNDVGRIAKVGTVELTEKMNVERYSHVMHIVSNVEGKLKAGHDAIDVLKATFPAGTVSGAPKIRAMEIIAELEPVRRGVYSGAIGYMGWNGNMDTAIAIRTAVIKDGELHIQAGAGIVADSVPEKEWQETLSKARAMFKAVEMATNGMVVESAGTTSQTR